MEPRLCAKTFIYHSSDVIQAPLSYEKLQLRGVKQLAQTDTANGRTRSPALFTMVASEVNPSS